MEDKSLNKINGVFEVDETYESNNWLRTSIRTYAFGKNQNGSDILNSSLSDFSKAKGSIGAVPIVAKYNDITDDLEGHNVILRKNKDDEYEIYHDTDAMGFTSPTTSFHIEEVNEGNEENPDYKTYVVIDDVYLWKRFDATKKIIQWISDGISAHVSMEIDRVEGQFDKDGYFQIHDFEFTGIAALGSDVEPCFPRAEIQLYTVNEFRKDLKELMSELSHSATQEGGTQMEDKTKVETPVVEATIETPEASATFSEGGITISSDTIEVSAGETVLPLATATFETETVESVESELETEEAIEETSEVETETQVFEQQAEVTPEEVLPEAEKETTQEFALTASQLVNQIRSELGKEHYHDTWGDQYRKYWYVDHTDSIVVFENCQDNYQLHAAPYSLNGDNVELNLAEVYKVKIEYVPFEGESTSFTANVERFSAEQSVLQSELDTLKSYKRAREEDDIKAKFADKLSEEEFTEVFSKMKESTIEDVEDKLFALYGKKNFSMQKPNTTKINKVVIASRKDDEKSYNPYGDIFED